MNRMPTIVALAISMLCTASVFSQTKPAPTPKPTPDFTGTWKYEKTESQNLNWPQPKSDKKWPRELGCVITQTASTITRTFLGNQDGKPYSYERTYFLDGRGETNPIEDDPNYVMISKTQLNKNSIVIRAVRRRKNGDAESDSAPAIQEWKISDGGKKLTTMWCAGNDVRQSSLCFKSIFRRE